MCYVLVYGLMEKIFKVAVIFMQNICLALSLSPVEMVRKE
jgi:hypothetical protein